MVKMNELSLLYKLKDEIKLQEYLICLYKEKRKINYWFTSFNKKYSNSVLLKAPYNSVIRNPYNQKWIEYQENIELCRACEYYLEALDE